METWTIPWLLLGVPCVGALLAWFAWSTLSQLKSVLLLATGASFVSLAVATAAIGAFPPFMPLLCVLPIAAFGSLLGQPLHRELRLAWLSTLPLLGLGLAAMTAAEPIRWLFCSALLLVVMGLLSRARTAATAYPAWGVGTYGLGVLAALVAAFAPEPIRTVAGILLALVLIPLFPLHAGHGACLTRLPANLPAFLVVLLPTVGLSILVTVLPAVPEWFRTTITGAALLSMVYASVRALSQSRPLPLLAHASLALCSILWWYVAGTGVVFAPVGVFLIAVSLTIAGLYLGWYAIRARYGDLDLRALGGLVQPMPRFAVLFSLLALAALGLPPFGVFSGFMGMVLRPAGSLATGATLVLLVWLAASWYFTDLMRRLLFGKPRADLRFEDLRDTEFASLALMLGLLLLLGLAPSRLFDVGTISASPPPAPESTVWNR